MKKHCSHIIHKTMYKLIKTKPLVFLILLLSINLIAFSQTGNNTTITGRVTDESGETLIGVNINETGTNNRVVTDNNGNYTIVVSSLNTTLRFSMVGFKEQTVAVSGQKRINIVLEEEVSVLDEVYVIGYGTARKKDLTGSMSQVKTDEMILAPVGSFDQALAGRVAGVKVSSMDGQPGNEMDIVIRGANSLTQSNAPLYVIDGVAIDDVDNSALNPEEIASINILKDASATAIYGARAANGVVVIETKRGVKEKPVLTYSGSIGFQQVPKKMEMMSPYEFVKYQLELNENLTKRLYLSGELSEEDSLYNPSGRTLEDYKTIKAVNWQDEILKTTPIQIHSIALRGRSSNTQYSLSGSYFNQEGIILNTGSKRYQARLSLDQRVNSNFKVGATVNVSRQLKYGQQVNQGGGRNFTSALLYRAWAYRPVSGNPNIDLSEFDDDPENDNPNDIRLNPVTTSIHEHSWDKQIRVMGNAYIDYTFLKNFRFRSVGSVGFRNLNLERFYNSKTTRGSPLRNSSLGVYGSSTNRETQNWSNENTITYTNIFNRQHNFTVVGGMSLGEYKDNSFGFTSQQVPNEELVMYGLDEGLPYSTRADGGENAYMSFFGRVDYNYKSKYYLTSTLRADASSKFHPANRWGYFPSVALAWNMKEENFMKSLKNITLSKLRFSYGLTGNSNIGNYGYFQLLGMPIRDAYSFNNATPTKGITALSIANEKLRWETTKQMDIGYDLALFRNRFELTVDVYKKVTKDLLLNADMPITTGQLRAYKNIGSIQNSGLEFTINTINVRSKDFRWSTNFNISFNRNKILSLTRNQESIFSQMMVGQNEVPLYISKIGYPAGMFFGYVFDGIYQEEDFDVLENGTYALKKELPDNGNPRSQIQPGHIKYRDLNGDGTINSFDMTVIGNGQPLHIGGLSNNFQYKNFTLNVLFQWSYGNQIYNANRMMLEGNYIGLMNTNQFATYIDRWTPENRSNTLFSARGYGPQGYQSNRVLEDGSYLRLKTLSFTYRLAHNSLSSIGISNIDFKIASQNLLTFTNYSGIDPEVSVRNTVLTPGFDYSPYPQARTITFGINVLFN